MKYISYYNKQSTVSSSKRNKFIEISSMVKSMDSFFGLTIGLIVLRTRVSSEIFKLKFNSEVQKATVYYNVPQCTTKKKILLTH